MVLEYIGQAIQSVNLLGMSFFLIIEAAIMGLTLTFANNKKINGFIILLTLNLAAGTLIFMKFGTGKFFIMTALGLVIWAILPDDKIDEEFAK